MRPALRTFKNRVLAPAKLELLKPDSWQNGKGKSGIREICMDQAGYFESIVDPMRASSLRRHAFQDRFIFELRDVVFNSENGQLYLERRPIFESRNDGVVYRMSVPNFLLPKLRTEELALVGVGRKPQNYYHWLLEDLPRILRVKKSLGTVRVVLNSGAPPYVLEALRLLDIPFVHARTLVRLDRVFVAATGVDAAWHHSGDVALIREAFNSPAQSRSSDLIIYVSRVRSTRGFTNEEEIETKLAELGVQVVYLEELRFKDQIDLFSRARAVIGNHGAGLSNIVFGPSDQKIIEITHANNINPCFETLARGLAKPYHRVIADPGPLLDQAKVSNKAIQELLKEVRVLRGQ